MTSPVGAAEAATRIFGIQTVAASAAPTCMIENGVTA